MNLAEDDKTAVQAASASRMSMRREAGNQLLFLSAQLLLGDGGQPDRAAVGIFAFEPERPPKR